VSENAIRGNINVHTFSKPLCEISSHRRSHKEFISELSEEVNPNDSLQEFAGF
jgi:hypothetical protein